MPAKSKQQQKFFGVVRAMQKGDIPKKGEAGEVADDMTKKDVKKMASIKHKGLPKKIKEIIKIALVKELKLNEVKPFVDNQLRKKWSYPKGDKAGLVYLATNDKRYPTEIVIYNIKRDMFHFMHSQMGKWSNPTQENVPANKLSSTHWVQEYFEEWKEDFDYEKGFYENKINESKKVDVIKRNLVKVIDAMKKNIEKFKKAKDAKEKKKYAKIAYKLQDEKKKLEKNLDTAILGIHADAELEIEEAALPKFKTPVEAYKWIMNKRGEAMDIETEMMETSKEIQMAYGEMEQDAEPGGGPIADRYGKEIEALENKHKDLRAQFDMVMAEIDEYDQNY